MAFDGITISAINSELKKALLGGRIDKVYQPEKDEIIISIRSLGKAYKLLLTANASHPRLHLTKTQKDNPAQPPLFCMVLRKHLTAGKILDITQPNFERIVNIHIESINELGDYSTKKLIIEIMGRHSNIILVDENNIVLDAAKRVTHDTSSVREVLPGKEYSFPPAKDKHNPLELSKAEFLNIIEEKSAKKINEIIYQSYNGISPSAACEICYRAKLDSTMRGEELGEDDKLRLFESFEGLFKDIKEENFSPCIIYDDKNKIVDFSPIEMKQFSSYRIESYSSVSELMDIFYKKRDLTYRMGQKTHDLKKLITQNIERCVKKKDIQQKTLKSIENRETLRLYGELITSCIYAVKKGMTNFTTNNFYDENYSEITIPLDPNLTPAENAQKYFKKYNKAKRTFEALQIQIKQNDEELNYLEGVLNSVQNSTDEQDIKEIRSELAEQGFIKRASKGKKDFRTPKKAKPLHFVSSDGYDIYVGKNNKQNDELTLKFARANDIWLHTKEIPGSHVIIVTNNTEVPNQTLNEAAMLSAFFSKAQNSSLVPVDYTPKKYVKKPSGAKPGMVIYETNKTAYVTPSEEEINKLKKID